MFKWELIDQKFTKQPLKKGIIKLSSSSHVVEIDLKEYLKPVTTKKWFSKKETAIYYCLEYLFEQKCREILSQELYVDNAIIIPVNKIEKFELIIKGGNQEVQEFVQKSYRLKCTF